MADMTVAEGLVVDTRIGDGGEKLPLRRVDQLGRC